jgi:hypothetical protein
LVFPHEFPFFPFIKLSGLFLKASSTYNIYRQVVNNLGVWQMNS